MPNHSPRSTTCRSAVVITLLIGLAGPTSACRTTNTQAIEHAETMSAADRSASLAALAAEQGGARYLVPISDADISSGPRSALVTIVVFVDYRPHEASTLASLEELLAAHPEDLRVVVKPRGGHPPHFSARAVLAAHSQGRGWAMHQQLYELMIQREGEEFVRTAQDAGVPDLERFEQERRADPPPELTRQLELAERLGVRRTPVMFVNGAPHGSVENTAQLTAIFEAERQLARTLIDAGARADEVYSSFMVHAASKREAPEHALVLPALYDGPALATRTLDSGVVVEDIERGDGRPVADGTVVHFNFGGYSDTTGSKVMGSRDQPAELILNAATRERDPIANAMCDAMLGHKPGGKLRVRVPAEIVERDAPPSRPKIGDLWVALEIVDVTDAPIRRGQDAFAGAPITSKKRKDGLETHDYAPGEGEPARTGMLVEFHYMLLLEDGTLIDSSHRKVEGLRVTLGKGGVVAGLEAGLGGARVGMLRKLIIPPPLGYGDKAQGKIPANSALIFLLEVVAVEPAEDQ